MSVPSPLGEGAGEAPSCLNCGRSLDPALAYCGHCGQKGDTHRLEVADIGHAAVHFFSHADHSALALLRDLALRPGRVAREYVSGRRRKHFSPFTFVLVVVGVASLVMAASGSVNFQGMAPPNPVSAFLQRNLNLVILIQLPLLALFQWALFRREQLHFAEHLAVASYASGFRAIFFTALVIPVWMLSGWSYRVIVFGYLVLWHVYFGIACAQFYEGNRYWAWFKGVLAAAATQVVTTAAIGFAIGLYFRLRLAP